MTATALLLGGTGQIGDATARALLAAGYEVTVASRSGSALPGVDAATVALDRADPAAVAAAAAGRDLVVDAVAFTPEHARGLLRLAGEVGSAVVISTGSVYLGDDGRAFDDVAATGVYPSFPVPIRETQPTIDRPGVAAYGALKAAMERVLLEQDALPVSVLRAGSVHGPRSTKLREWFFIRRALDGRTRVALARGGRQRFSTSSTLNIAALATACAARPGTRVLNAVDDESLTMREIAAVVYDRLGVPLEVVAFEGPPAGGAGRTPWDAPVDFVCDPTAAHDLGGYAPVAYPDAVAADIAWIRSELESGRDPDSLFAGAAGWFDYAAEDGLLEELG